MYEETLVSLNHISKAFPGVQALRGVSLTVRKGEIVALVGENGAGKSTLMKILSGGLTPDGGEIVFDGRAYPHMTPALARSLGIAIIHQENLLAPTMTVAENAFIGHERTRRGLMDFDAMRARAQEELDALGLRLDLTRRVEELSAAQQQYVKILKAMMFSPRLLIMDEPTSMFNVEDAAKILSTTEGIASRGIGVIYISHFLKEVVRIADRVVVLRDGQVVSSYDNPGRDLPLGVITRDMVGRPVDMFYARERGQVGETLFEARNIRVTPQGEPLSFSVRRGEILGIAGMVGAGRTEILRAISGAAPLYGGELYMRNQRVTLRSPADGVRLGIGHVTEDRQRLGLMLNQSVTENTTLVALMGKLRGLLVHLGRQAALAAPVLDGLQVKYHSPWQEARTLSGGNQQKVVLAKWLFADAELILFDEPTRGIDVNAKWEFYKIMTHLARAGKSIVMVSSDMPEIVSMSDRILVVRGGRVTRELAREEISEENIIQYALGVDSDE